MLEDFKPPVEIPHFRDFVKAEYSMKSSELSRYIHSNGYEVEFVQVQICFVCATAGKDNRGSNEMNLLHRGRIGFREIVPQTVD